MTFRRAASLTISLSASLLAVATSLPAQTHKVAATENVTRAVGVYEWTGALDKPTASRLVPVTIFLNKHFEDAGIYLARPVPFTLAAGVVYSVEKAGLPIGTLTLDHASQIVTRHSATDDNPLTAWYGYGNFVLPGAAKPDKTLRASGTPAVIVGSGGTAPAEDDSDRPTMTRRAENAPLDTTASSSTSVSAGPAPEDDPDRPTLKKKQEKADAKAAKKERESGSVEPLAVSLNDDPNRPTMHRGKPLGSIVAPPLKGLPPEMKQEVAVSDAVSRDEHLFSRDWDNDNERLTTLVAMQNIAQPGISAYMQRNGLKPPQAAEAEPAAPLPKRNYPKPPPKPAPVAVPIVLEEEQLTGYTLTYGGLPTFVYTAQTLLQEGGPVYVTVVAQRLPSGEVQRSLLSVTDAQHLDRTPWLRPVDAVDPDASHRASLLFELRGQTSREFGLYRLTSAVAEQPFLTSPSN